MTVASVAISAVQQQQVAQAASLIANAFADDPLVTWVFPDPNTRLDKVNWLYGHNVAYAVRHGRVDTTPDLTAVAVWLSPGKTSMTTARLVRQGMLLTPVRLGLTSLWRISRYTRTKTRLHHQSVDPSSPHWYLLATAVAPQAQGQGLGRGILQPVLRQADQDQLRCYLETANEKNVGFFRRLGFVVTAQATVPGGGPSLWAMVRQPGG